MVIKNEGKGNAHYEKNGQHNLLVQMREDQTEKVNEQNEELSRNHVRHNRAHKKALLAFKGHIAGRAVLSDIKEFLENRSITTGRAT